MYYFSKQVNHQFISIIILFFNLKPSTTKHITVYEGSDFKGKRADVSISECSNLPDNLIRDVYSVNTKGNCARLYDDTNCFGNFIEILPRSPAHNNLPVWDFGNKAESAGPCPDSCSTDIIGHLFENNVEVQIYSLKDYKGPSMEINVNGCIELPRKFWNQTNSVHTNGQCIQLYNTSNCRIDGLATDTVELRLGTPYHNDLKNWGMKTTKSISHCAYKCSMNSSLNLPVQDQAYMFTNTYFGGHYLALNMSNKSCIDVPEEFNGLSESVSLGNQTCLSIFDRKGCRGNTINLSESKSQLSSVNFDARIRSLKSCIFGRVPILSRSSTEKTNYEDQSMDNNNDHGISPVLIAVIVVVPILGMILTAMLVLLVVKRCNSRRKVLDKLSEKEIQEFLSGYAINLEVNQQSGSTGNSNEYSTELLAQNKPFNSEYEVPRSNIDFDTGAPLGAGEFGTVYKGMLKVNSENENPGSSSQMNTQKIPIAIKTVNPAAGLHGLRSLLKEVKVMLYLGQNTNIAHMVGCCTEKLRQGEIMVLMEYCSGGSLETYLQKNRDSFKNLVNKGRLDIDNESRKTLGLLNENPDEFSQKDFDFNIFMITKWSIEVARGMEFLSNAKVIHSDLAARNILLTDKMNAKISDFGLSRQLYSYSQYMKKQQEPLPWRWMALESLKSLEFSTKSDVWSYGILCWEMFTLGEKPYSGLAWNEAFISNLEGGLRPNKPRNATNEFYNLMLQCWEEFPNRRPSFLDIIEEIEEIIANFFAVSESHIVL